MRSLLICVAVVGCVDPPWVAPEVNTAGVERKEIPISRARAVDILIVVDTSPATQSHAENLAHNWPNFANVLDTIVGGRPSLHLGVTSADPADDGAFHGPTRGDTFLIDAPAADGTRVRNYDGRLGEAIAGAASFDPGTDASQPLAMARRALLRHPGFVRDDAYLLLIVVSARDDGSTATVLDLADFFKATKTMPEQLIVAAATGPRAMSCEYEGNPATAAPRLLAFLDEFPNRNTFTTICQQDLSGVMQQLGQWRPIIGDPCFETKVRVETCTAWLHFDDRRADMLLPRCGLRVGACFEVVEEPIDCAGRAHQRARWYPAGDPDRFTIECERE